MSAAKAPRPKRQKFVDRLGDGLVAEGWRTPNTYVNAEFGALPDAAGVYLFSYKEDMLDPKGVYRIVYVGKSANLRKRHRAHPVRAKIEQSGAELAHIMCWFKPADIEAIAQLEVDLIKKYDPSFNTAHRAKHL